MEEEPEKQPKSATVVVTNVPRSATAGELVGFFSSAVGPVFAVKISSARTNWHSTGRARIQFDFPSSAVKALAHPLTLNRSTLQVIESCNVIVPRGVGDWRLDDVTVKFGNLIEERSLEVLGEFGKARVEVVKGKEGVLLLMVFVEYGGEIYKLEVSLGNVINSFGCRVGGGERESNAVLLQLKYAPKIFHKICGPSLSTKFNSARYHYCKEDVNFLWVRSPDFSERCIIGRSCYLCLELGNGLSSSKVLEDLPYFRELGNLTLKQGELTFTASKLVPIVNCTGDCSVPFEILFQLNSLVHMQKISSAHVNSDLFNVLSGLSIDTVTKILQKMHKMDSTCFKPVHFIQNQLGKWQSSAPRKQENLMSIHRVLITPSKVYFYGPELETCNYVVKHYSAYASDFIRVTFVDEDRCKLPSQAISTRIEQDIFSKPYRTGIYGRILSVLIDGISIGTKKFEFLAFSASQLRDNSVWMFASNDFVTADAIREWMGQFNEIYSVSKCAARMGQLFSSSTPTFNIPSHDARVIRDVEIITDGIKYCFSDGIGKISASFAKQVAKKCGLSRTPSAFQIRYGGYKGVIAVDRTSFCKLSLRPSMLKFKSTNTMLNVTKWSESQPYFLNREIISLLSTLGINDEIFESLQHDQMCLLADMLSNRDAALKVLRKMRGSGIKTAIKMLLHGYEPMSEPYLLMMLRAYQEYQISDIRSKCRISVPKGRVLIGCLDELGTLDYGQVFLRVTLTEEELQNHNQASFEKVDQSTGVVVGKVVVTKNPCLHPGDIRVLQAVYDPKLDNVMGLVDCLVFPQKGPRPHPNECSGGDLDGDMFSISWDERLIPQKTVAPMDYIPPRPRVMDHKVTLEEVHKFFVNYMINDNLGAISTAHLVHADSEPDKAQSWQCLALAKLHSMAVDYAKTGAPAEMPNNLRPRRYPDFMERFEKPRYKSTGVLGKLYRASANRSEINYAICEVIPYDRDLEVDGFEEFVEIAEEYYEQYVDRLRGLMKYYDVGHEEEILTGYMRNYQMYLREKRKYEDMKDRMLTQVKSLHNEVEEWFRSSCGEGDFMKMAAAWYHVTYHRNYCGEGTRFLSFPWVMSDVLLSIKASKACKNLAAKRMENVLV